MVRERVVRARPWLLALATVVAAWCLLFGACRHYLRTAYPCRYSDSVTRYAAQYDFDPALIYALIRTESGFDAEALSSAEARGLMQITADTLDWARSRLGELEFLSADALYDPDTNIRYGVVILSLLREQFADERTMLAAYNAGIGNVRRWLSDPVYSDDGETLRVIPYPETRAYVDKIPAARERYRRLYTHLEVS